MPACCRSAVQVTGEGASSNGTSCAALCPSVKDVLCQLEHKCWKSLASLIGGLVGLLGAGQACICVLAHHAANVRGHALAE